MAYEASLGLIALTRFGYGPRGDGDVGVAAGDPRGFLKAELAQPGIALLSGPGLPTTTAAIQDYFRDSAARKMERLQNATTAKPDGIAQDVTAKVATAKVATAKDAVTKDAVAKESVAKTSGPSASATMGAAAPPAEMAKMAAAPDLKQAEAKPAAKPPTPEQIIFRDEALARIRRAIEARSGIAERLVAFWSNHFCISAAKGDIARVTAGAFEREAIRPHVLGRFADMLLAVERHPAMLHYLDNAQSVGPGSRAGQRGRRGLNENLGREILELHTMGVGSGYSQTDVTNLAKILTGWTYVGPRGIAGDPGTFLFNPGAHEPGPITLLGKSYAEDGVEQGRAALLDVARRPETAHFIVGKLAAAFVAEEPPRPLVDRLARVFLDTDGDLRALTLALIDAPESWVRTPVKMRNPYDFVIATHRLLNRLPDTPGVVLGPLNNMGMSLWTPPGPNGFPQKAAAWASPEGMKLRLDYCALVADRLKEPPNPSELLDALSGGVPSPETRQAVARAESRQQGLALLLMSPEMQRS